MKLAPYGLLAVIAATITLFWIVPEFPLAHLDDPSHWGVIGYAVTVVVIGARVLGRLSAATERRWMVSFLIGMPLIYVANWRRFGGTGGWLSVELFGVFLYGAVAWLSLRRSPWFLPVGIAGHGLWDGAHYDKTDFVPNWYVVGCLVVDVAVAVYLATRLSESRSAAVTGSIGGDAV